MMLRVAGEKHNILPSAYSVLCYLIEQWGEERVDVGHTFRVRHDVSEVKIGNYCEPTRSAKIVVRRPGKGQEFYVRGLNALEYRALEWEVERLH